MHLKSIIEFFRWKRNGKNES